MAHTGSDNLVGADNQQERLSSQEARVWFLAGFVEGEGSVTLSIKRRPGMKFGCYVQPEFFLYQHRSRRALLEMAQEHFGSGKIRPKPGNTDVLVYSVISRRVLRDRVIPFLQLAMRFSERRRDFVLFANAVRLLENGHHREAAGMVALVEIAYSMNMGGKQRRLSRQALLDRILRGHMPDTPRPE
jgi:hypothetical protein